MSVVKPPYMHSIVNVRANEIIPETLMHKLCTEHRSCVGLTVRESNKMVVEKFLELGTVEEQFQLLMDINKNTAKLGPRQFVFIQAPAEFDEDECQPWTPIKDSKGNALVTVCIEGDLPGRTSAENYSEAFVTMHEYLGPKLEDVFKLSSHNPTKLFEFINSESFKKDLALVYGFRGAFAFMPSVGEPIMLGNFREEGKGGSDYTWGSCSFNHGYTEAVVEAAKPAKEATMPKRPTSKYASNEPEPVAEPKEPVPSVPKVIPTKPSDPIEKVAEKLDEGQVKWAPPAGLHGKGLKKAYRDMLGHLPEDWQQRPSFMIRAKTDADVAAAAGVKPAATAKDMKKDAPTIVLPVIDGNQQAKAVDFIKKHLGDGSLEIGNPLEAQKQEATFAKFSEMCLKSGDLQEIRRWPVSAIFTFAKQNPEVFALAFIELRRELINRVWDGQKTLGELTGTETPGTTKTEPESPTPLKAEPGPATPEPRRASKYA